MSATPRPWVAHKQKNVGNMPWGQLTNVCTQEEQGQDTVYTVLAENCTEADAALIVHAVNMLDETKAALEDVDTWFKYDCPSSEVRKAEAMTIQLKIKAVLAKLDGG